MHLQRGGLPVNKHTRCVRSLVVFDTSCATSGKSWPSRAIISDGEANVLRYQRLRAKTSCQGSIEEVTLDLLYWRALAANYLCLITGNFALFKGMLQLASTDGAFGPQQAWCAI
jgi:hypothetical protein